MDIGCPSEGVQVLKADINRINKVFLLLSFNILEIKRWLVFKRRIYHGIILFMRYLRLIFSSPLLMIILAVVIGLAGTSYYFYQKSKNVPVGQEQAVLAETNALVKEISKFMVLPEGETPTIATVSDPQALEGKEFFIDAKKGDKVLIYTTKRKAILYDPVAKKIVNVAPVTFDSNISGTKTEASPEQQ